MPTAIASRIVKYDEVKKFTQNELSELLTEDMLGSIPQILALNQIVDFVDLSALARNVLYMVMRNIICDGDMTQDVLK